MRGWQFLTLIVFALLILSGWFYWFQWRPSEIMQACAEHMRELNKMSHYTVSQAEGVIRICVKDHGL